MLVQLTIQKKSTTQSERHAELPSCLGNASDTSADQLLLRVYAIANISHYIVHTQICTSQSLDIHMLKWHKYIQYTYTPPSKNPTLGQHSDIPGLGYIQ